MSCPIPVGPPCSRRDTWRPLLRCVWGSPCSRSTVFWSPRPCPPRWRRWGGVAYLSWATTVFLVFAIMGGAGAALLKARFGARGALVMAASVFLLGSLLAAIAGAMPQLLVGRALQGLGEGIVAAICYALIPELFPSALVPKVFGTESIVWAIAAFGGPVLSGALTELVSWRAAFAVKLPIGAVFMALVLTVVPRGTLLDDRQRFPIVRLVLIGTAIMAVSVGGVLRSPALTALCLVLAGATLVGVIVRDRTAQTPIFPLRAFRLDDVVGAGLWVILLMPLAQAGGAVYLVTALADPDRTCFARGRSRRAHFWLCHRCAGVHRARPNPDRCRLRRLMGLYQPNHHGGGRASRA